VTQAVITQILSLILYVGYGLFAIFVSITW